jgi:hypothetical protein
MSKRGDGGSWLPWDSCLQAVGVSSSPAYHDAMQALVGLADVAIAV